MRSLAICLVLAVCAGAAPAAQDGPEARLAKLGLTLPPPNKPIANYVTAVRTDNLIYLAGHGPCGELQPRHLGKLGDTLTVEQGYAVARETGLCLLATLKAQLGSLDRVARVVKVLGMVNAAPTFKDHPEVVNGCSDLMVEVFGENGKHARSSVGMGSLPGDLAVEIEMVVEVRP